MLISSDLMRFWQDRLPYPAQLVLARIIGSDTQYILRVRCGEVSLDYPLEVSTLLTKGKPKLDIDIYKIGDILNAMGELVVPPGQRERNEYYNMQPQVVAPIPWEEANLFHELPK